MRRKKNITLNLQNITPHFTGKEKIITLVSIIIILSLANIINTSALSYSSSVNVDFTFNPTISISLSSDNLDISNLTPGNTLDSNDINISVSSNNANGYTMLATVGNTEYNNTSLNHSNGINDFSSITTDANLSSLTADNTWGYSYSIDSGYSWSNYNGLSLYSDTGATLINKLGPTESNIAFKIAAKASSTQASGTYNNVINFIAITRPNPISLEDAYDSYYSSTGKTKHNGYYVMQDMNSTICNNVELLDSELQVIDIRDEKVYWMAKLRDGNCWMTQNLDLDLIQNKTYTHADTDLGWAPDNFNVNATWKPTGNLNWAQQKIGPYYVDLGNKYVYTSNSDADDIIYDSLSSCISAGHTDCEHYHIGNYYNWNAARANGDDDTSICPAGWRLPNLDSNEYGNLLTNYNIIQNNTSTTYLENGFNNIRKAPLYFVRAGGKGDFSQYDESPGVAKGTYYYNKTTLYVGYMSFYKNNISPIRSDNPYQQSRYYGWSVRCLAR